MLDVYYTPRGLDPKYSVIAVQVTKANKEVLSYQNPQFRYPLYKGAWVVYSPLGVTKVMSDKKFKYNYAPTSEKDLPMVHILLSKFEPQYVHLLRASPEVVDKTEVFARKEEELYAKFDALLGATK